MICSESRLHFSRSCSLAEHDLFRKPASTFRGHAVWRSMTFSENRHPLFGVMLLASDVILARVTHFPLRSRGSRGPLNVAGHCGRPSRNGRSQSSDPPFPPSFASGEELEEGVPLCIGAESAMFCIGQHCCPNWWPVARAPESAGPDTAGRRAKASRRGRGRAGARQTSNQAAGAARRLPPERKRLALGCAGPCPCPCRQRQGGVSGGAGKTMC
jgi:hypothetical protein